MASKTKKRLLSISYAIVVLLTVISLVLAVKLQIDKAEAGANLTDSIAPVFVMILYLILFPAVLLVEFEVFYIFKYFLFSQHKTKAQTIINVVCLALPLFVLGVLFLLTEYTFAGNAPGVIYFLWLGAHLLFRLLYFTIGAGRAKPAAREQEEKQSY